MTAEIGLRDKLFDLSEAKTLLPLVAKVTEIHQKKLAPIQMQLEKMLANDPRRNVYEHDYEMVVAQWLNKIELLGARVSGLWTVEFDVGEGSLCWRYPELSLAYFRPTGSEFAERLKLRDYIEEQDPDWV